MRAPNRLRPSPSDRRSPVRAARALAPALLAALLAAAPARAQNGDKRGEPQPPLPEDLVVPPAPVLDPVAQHATFALLDPELEIELVAAEPLVVDPVTMRFDGEGRLWVCEMRGYMPDADGTGEHEPVGQIAVLLDHDGDGRMDERRTFLDGLVLARGVVPTRGGALVIAPPDLLFARDTDGDLVADEVTKVLGGMNGLDNPEHAINGLWPGLDNWFHMSQQPVRLRWDGDAIVRAPTRGGGQWGIAEDDWGRVFFNTNPDPLRGDLFPSHYAVRNPSLGAAHGANVGFVGDKSTWPARINPGVNRGYRKGTLRDDYTLRVFTGACSPAILRGGGLGEAYRGDAFVCEPTGNLVKRYRLERTDDGGLRAVNPVQGHEFWTSTDERFRPVALCDGPDGCLYVADMARGLIQHRLFLTTFLRRQAEERGLVEPHALGRIWRVRRRDTPRTVASPLADLSWADLVARLDDANGWARAVAQQAIVDDFDGDPFVRRQLEALARDADARPEARARALWSLEGIDEERVPLLLDVLRTETDPRVLAQALRVGEEWLATGDAELTAAVRAVARAATDPDLRQQAIHSLGSARTAAADAGLLELAVADVRLRAQGEGVVSGLYRRELEFVEGLLADGAFATEATGRASLLKLLARCVVREGSATRIDRLLHLAADVPAERAWQRRALCEGVLAARPTGPDGEPAPVRVAQALPGCAALASSGDGREADPPSPLAEVVATTAAAFAWPGRPGYERWELRPLTDAERARFERGRELYHGTCAACHQPSGLGDPGQAPPLRDQPWPLGPPERFAAILLHGLSGPVTVSGETWDAEMPAFSLDDAALADVMTYVRREWGHGSDPVEPALVERVRAALSERRGPFTLEELEDLRVPAGD